MRDEGDLALLICAALQRVPYPLGGFSDLVVASRAVHRYLDGRCFGIATSREGVAQLWESCACELDGEHLRDLLMRLGGALRPVATGENAVWSIDNYYSSVDSGRWHEQWWKISSSRQFLDPLLRQHHRAVFVKALSARFEQGLVDTLIDDWTGTLAELEETLDTLGESYVAR